MASEAFFFFLVIIRNVKVEQKKGEGEGLHISTRVERALSKRDPNCQCLAEFVCTYYLWECGYFCFPAHLVYMFKLELTVLEALVS